ncbi:hypothetical protein B6C97_11190 [Gilliamella apis]|uniref:hypothetical protein n=1 Tax=Gilliamella apis TaxID=1970738 RepID=UPI000A355872|nr:hypothetical protein [Gilliamella apis]OTQ55247.1 hypothetical protein B6C97_11190 [Gilliamella apis]
MVLVLTVVVLQSISFANYALTTTTTNIIYGSAPYLTFDGGRTRVTNTEALLGISLSDGRAFTPTTNSSIDNPIELPVAGQSFNDIGMLVPRDTDSIALSSLIGTPYNYWGDDDGDGQGVNGVTATGSLNLSIVDNFNNPVTRNEVLNICRAPYKLTLSNGSGRLTTRYGVPNESRFTASNATYYINPKPSPVICFAKPSLLKVSHNNTAGPVNIWNPEKGFLTQSVTPSSYGLNFPTTGANNLFFDLDIVGVSQALSWAPVSHAGITATMTDSTSTGVRVTLTGPFATYSQQQSERNGIASPSLPQVFELVGRDSSGNAVVKYGFKLKQWFVNRGHYRSDYYKMAVWCSYHIPEVKDLTNASCQGAYSGPHCQGAEGARPSSPDNHYRRHIGGGLFSEWGVMTYYTGADFINGINNDWVYWSVIINRPNSLYDTNYVIVSNGGLISTKESRRSYFGLCVYP